MGSVIDAEVRLHGRPVGRLRYEKGGSQFTYTDDLTSPGHRPLGQLFEDDPGAVRRARVGLPAWFANLLPEGEMRRQAERGLGGRRVGDFTLLTRLGTHLPGAVGVHASDEPADRPLRPSLAGMQLKYSVRSERLAFPASGDGGWWIVTLPDRSLRDLTANGYLTMSWLRRAGYDVPLVRLERAATIPDIPEGLVDPDDHLYLPHRPFRPAAGRPGARGGLRPGRRRATPAEVRRLRRDVRRPGRCRSRCRRHRRIRGLRLALSLNGEVMTAHLRPDDFRRLAERAGADPETTAESVRLAVHELRGAWTAGARAEAERLFPALARHYEHRLASLPIVDGSG